MDAEATPGPLSGLLVCDFSRVLAGPYATMLLGDLGATVIKVESPDGDDSRRWGPPWHGEHSTYFQSINRNKRSLVLDLREAGDQELARRLAARSDILLENFKAGTAERLGVGYEQLRTRNPALIYCSITGYGAGDGAPLPAYDLIIQAVSGLASITGPDPETPTKSGIPIADLITGLHAAVGTLAALQERHRTGEGQRIDLNLLSSTLSAMVNFTGAYVMTGEIASAMGMRHPSICPYEPFPTADRPLIIAAGNDRQFARLCKVIDLPELADDIRFATNEDRVRYREALFDIVAERLRQRSARAWRTALTSAGVPCGPINDVGEAITTADQLGLSPVVTLAGIQQIASPFSMSRTPVTYRHPPPSLGEASVELRRWLERHPSSHRSSHSDRHPA